MQLTLLGEKICNTYNKKKQAFILFVLTRRDKQVKIIESVFCNGKALNDLSEDNRCGLSPLLKQLLWDSNF